jgi:hypothetical protein
MGADKLRHLSVSAAGTALAQRARDRHDAIMIRRRGRGSGTRGPEQEPRFEFELVDPDSGEDDGPAGAGEGPGGDPGYVFVGAGAPDEVDQGSSGWSRLPRRRRITILAAACALVAGAAAAVWQVRAADQRAADRYTLVAVHGGFFEATFFPGLDFGVTLEDKGPAQISVLNVQVDQPGLAEAFSPVPVQLKVGEQTEIRLEGIYDCRGGTGPVATSVTVLAADPDGHVSTLVLKLPPDSGPPAGWQIGRSEYCHSAAARLYNGF